MLHVNVDACTNDYLRCTKCEMHDRERKHVIRYTKKRVTRFLILEALTVRSSVRPKIGSLLFPKILEEFLVQ